MPELAEMAQISGFCGRDGTGTSALTYSMPMVYIVEAAVCYSFAGRYAAP